VIAWRPESGSLRRRLVPALEDDDPTPVVVFFAFGDRKAELLTAMKAASDIRA
jgi:hypothetical protein